MSVDDLWTRHPFGEDASRHTCPDAISREQPHIIETRVGMIFSPSSTLIQGNPATAKASEILCSMKDVSDQVLRPFHRSETLLRGASTIDDIM